MANRKKEYPVPKFSSLEEEDKFWQSHSPLIEGYEGKVQKKKQNRASFLSIRLTGEQLAQLREIATHYGLGPSTYARQLLIQGIESRPPHSLLDLLIMDLYEQLDSISSENKEEYLRHLMEIAKQYSAFQESIATQMAALRLPSQVKDQIRELHQEESGH